MREIAEHSLSSSPSFSTFALISISASVPWTRDSTNEIFPNVEAIQNHHGVTKRPVELYGDALARIGFRKLKNTPVPTDARLRIIPAERFAAVIRQLRGVREGKLHSPIMGQVDGCQPLSSKFNRVTLGMPPDLANVSSSSSAPKPKSREGSDACPK
jgi:hypothetical protein